MDRISYGAELVWVELWTFHRCRWERIAPIQRQGLRGRWASDSASWTRPPIGSGPLCWRHRNRLAILRRRRCGLSRDDAADCHRWVGRRRTRCPVCLTCDATSASSWRSVPALGSWWRETSTYAARRSTWRSVGVATGGRASPGLGNRLAACGR